MSELEADAAAEAGASSKMPRLGPPFLLLLFLVLLGCGMLYAPVMSGARVIAWRDVYQNYEPMLGFMARSLQSGELPLWNPGLFAGSPQMAGMEPPLFYPPAWLFFLGLPFQLALVLNLSLHQLIAAAGVWGFGRSLGWPRPARALSALLFAFSGVLVSMSNLHPLLDTAVWLPWALWACHALCRDAAQAGIRQALKPTLGLAAVYGLQILSGHLEIVYVQSLLLLAYAVMRRPAVRDDRPVVSARLQSMAMLLAAIGLGVGLGAIQLLPALSYLPQTLRQSAADGAGSQEWSYHPLLSPELLLPQLGNGEASLQALYGEALFGHQGLFNQPYLGVLPWLLLPAGLLLRRREGMAFFCLAGLLCLLLAWGQHLPLYGLLLQLPGMKFFRYPSKLLIFVTACLSLATGAVFANLLAEPSEAKKPAAFSLLAGLAALLAWFGSRSPQALEALSAHVSELRPDLSADWVLELQAQLSRGLLGFAILSLIFAALLFLLRRREAALLPIGALLLAVSLDLLSSGSIALRTSPASRYTQPAPVAQALQQHLKRSPGYRFALAHEFAGLPETFAPSLKAPLRYDAYAYETLQHNHGLDYGLSNLYGFWPARSQQINFLVASYMLALDSQVPDFRHSLETLTGTRWLLTAQAPPAIEAYLGANPAYIRHEAFPATSLEIWENRDALPRLRFQTEALALPDREAMIMAMAEPDRHGFDPRRQVLLLEDAALSEALRQVPPTAAGKAALLTPALDVARNQSLELRLETSASGYLVLADQKLPGWRAYDNGREVPILSANYLQQAIRLGPGQHAIRFVYSAPGFAAGAAISASALLAMLGLSAWGFGKRHAQASDPA